MADYRNPIPTSSKARPIINSPMDFILSFLAKVKMSEMAPNVIGRLNALVDSPSPKSVIIHAVTVVPILAPMITATAPASDSKPAFTKLTTMTVVADDD